MRCKMGAGNVLTGTSATLPRLAVRCLTTLAVDVLAALDNISYSNSGSSSSSSSSSGGSSGGGGNY